MNGPALSTDPIVPGAPPWQPPPAFTAAAAGMQVWPSSAPQAHGAPQWPAATGEPVWSETEEAARPGESEDIAVWPPSAVLPDGLDDNTANVRTSPPTASGRQEPAVSTPPPGPDASPPAETAPAATPPGAGHVQAPQPGPGTHPIGPPASEPTVHPIGPPAPESTVHPSAPMSSPEPASPPSVPALVAQDPTSQPELMPQVSPTPLESGTDPQAPTAPSFESAAPPSPPGDQLTPPGGIPMIAPPFPSVPATPSAAAQQSGPSTGAIELRGPFTPPSAVVPEVVTAPPAPPARSKTSILLIAAVVTVVVGGIGTGAFYAYQSFSAKKTVGAAGPAPSSEPVDPTEDPPPDEPEPVSTTLINSERTDPGKMTVAATFTKKVKLAGTTFVRVKTDVTRQCQKAAAGKFANALRSGDCRQVLRATYVDSKRKYAVTTGIAVLPTRESAVEADRAKNLNSNLWFRGLPGTPGTGAERVHIAGGYAAGMVWGRYIVFSYATFSDGHTPTAKEKNLGKVSGAFRDQTAKVVERRVTS
ncbi:hypothetical protein ACQPYK_06160 [Streptosporangium sp. CA-135522]|uniref:hypothetical protein n=1 Tax=Streptosporangium sp. CA-135522 TaxID=3240072 RepID=UPI003D8C9C46